MSAVMSTAELPPAIATTLFRPGMRIAVACSGGADSVALLRTLVERRNQLGLVLSVAHVNHGIRGAESDADQAFVESLAAQFALPFQSLAVDTPAIGAARHEGLEEAARKLRYAWFWKLLAASDADAIVTAHTLDDQSETVLHRLLRGAWTEGLSGIHPVLKPGTPQSGLILRPFLATTRQEIEAWLRAIGQPWREDSTNRDTAYTRNRIRHELLPALAGYNPGIKKQFAQLATLARDEDGYWQAELTRLLPSLLLSGKAVRGGGRATDTLAGSESLSIEIERLRVLHPALRRRILRAAAAQLGVSLDFEDTERLLAVCGVGETGVSGSASMKVKLQIQNGLRAERSPRELKLFRLEAESSDENTSPAEYKVPVPGSVDAPAFGLHLEATLKTTASESLPEAVLRSSRPGDRVTLRHSRSPLKIREALKRARLPASAVTPPVLEWQGEIVWMPGFDLDSEAARAAGLVITAAPLSGIAKSRTVRVSVRRIHQV